MKLKTFLALTALCTAPAFAAAQQQAAPDSDAYSAPKSTGPASAQSGVPASSKAPALDLSLPSARIQEIVAGSAAPRFDGADSSSDSAPDAVPVARMGSLSSPTRPPAAPKPQPTALEKNLFWSTWWGYHATFAADFTTTGMVIGRGGYETDPLYTRFGNKNMTGVIGSAVVLHAVASVGSYALYREAEKKHGVWRHVLMAAAVGINAVGIEAHVQGTAQNVGVLRNWNR